MPGDVCRVPAGKLPRKSEKRKKKRAKKKPAMAPTTENILENGRDVSQHHDAVFPVEKAGREVPLLSPPETGNMSPRKQTLMRHKSSRESVGEPLFVSEVKELKRNRRTGPGPDAVDGKYLLILASQPMDEKTALFTAPLARIVLFLESSHGSPVRASPGTLLAHGEFEIFQLHGGDVTYLACGKSFVYPLLPKLKILRTSARELVLPLVNPQRYWKIHIETHDETVFHALEAVLQKVVRYTSLAANDEAETGTNTHAGHVAEISVPEPLLLLLEGPLPDVNTPYTPYFAGIPESPPSGPESPLGRHLYTGLASPHTPLPLPWDTDADTLPPVQTLTSAMASFGLPPAPTHTLGNPFFHETVHVMGGGGGSNGYGQFIGVEKEKNSKKPVHMDADSDTLSMDSLLDEYEETISVTKSTNRHASRHASRQASRPVSRTPSHAASHVSALPHHHHNYILQRPGLSLHHGLEGHAFPPYRRAIQPSTGGRSRRSSVSELYSSTSNWMEPGHAHPEVKLGLSSSKSTYSLAPKKPLSKSNVNDTCREIYRSLTLHNLSLIAGNGAQSTAVNPKPHTAVSGIGAAGAYPGKHPFIPHRGVQGNGNNNDNGSGSVASRTDGLSSTEVFKLISEREPHKQTPSTGLRKLFGW